MTKPVLYGGIEGGGTKFVCAVGTGPEDIQAEIRFPTTTGDEVLARCIEYFQAQQAKEPLAQAVETVGEQEDAHNNQIPMRGP